MPWSGGVYTRGYPSWTNDANANLPISATKFDTEDNDFAAGLNNCLTIDGLNKPNTTLTWAQALSVLSLAVTGSGVPQNGIYLPSANVVGLATAATQRVTIGATGAVTVNVPGSALPALSLNGAVGAVVADFNGASTADCSIELDLNGTAKGFYGIAGATNGIVLGSAVGDFALRSQGGAFRFAINSGVSAALAITTAGVVQAQNDAGTLLEVGYRDLTVNTQGSNYTTVAADRGNAVRTSSAINVTLKTAYPVGTVLIIINTAASASTLIAGGSDTLVLAGTASTGNRTIAQNGVCTAWQAVAGFWYCSGPGVS